MWRYFIRWCDGILLRLFLGDSPLTRCLPVSSIIDNLYGFTSIGSQIEKISSIVMPNIMSVSPQPDHDQTTSTIPISTTPNPSPQERSLPLLLSPHTTLHLQITCLETSTLAFVTTTDPSNAASLSSLGSFVYAMPNVSPSSFQFFFFLANNQRCTVVRLLSLCSRTV